MKRITLLTLLFAACGLDESGMSAVSLDAGADAEARLAAAPTRVAPVPVDTGVVSAGGGTIAAGGTGGVGGTAESPPAGGAPVAPTEPVCEEGEVVFTATYWCEEWDSDSPNALWRDDCREGAVQHDYYLDLPCPFDVAIAHDPSWEGPCSGCLEDRIITNGGTSKSASWRGDGEGRYCCDGNQVRYGR